MTIMTTARPTSEHGSELAELASRIRTEHQLCQSAFRGGLAHALEAGKLLLEAKGQCPHGEWGRWLREHCRIPERTAQAYMRVARGLAAGDPQRVADLSLRGALKQLAAPRPEDSDASREDDLWSQAEALLDGPFSDLDFDFEESGYGWLQTKLLHHAKVPAVAGICLALTDDYKIPALQLCSDEELITALRIVAPLAKGTVPIHFDSSTMGLTAAINRSVVLKIIAQRVCGLLYGELDDRQRRSDETFARRRAATASRLLRLIDERLAELGTSKEEPV